MTSALRRAGAALALLGLAFAFTPSVSAKGGGDQVVIQFLASTGADADGTARARWRDQGAGELDFNVELDHLDPGSYDLYVTDLIAPKATITVDALGDGEIEFAIPQDGVKPLFDFPVFDETIEVRQGATVFFHDTFGSTGAGGGAGGGGSAGDKTKLGVYMVNVGPDFDAQGKLKYQAKATKTKFSIEVEKLAPGTYDVLVGGAPVSQITTVSSAAVEVEFQDPVEPGKTLLNFDPLGAQVDVVQGATVFLTGILPAANGSTGTQAPSKPGKGSKDLGKKGGDSLLVSLASSGTIPGAKGKAKLSQTGETEFEIEIEHVPAGAYDFFVAGVQRGTLVTNVLGEAQLDYSTSPGGAVLLLDFEVKGQLLEVKSGPDTILSTVFPVSVQAALGLFSKETFKANKVKVNLVNAGVDLDARGGVTWKLSSSGKQTVTIDARDLDAGTYGVRVDGVLSATALSIQGAPYGKGKLVFSSAPSSSQALLDFDPVDATVELLDATDTVVLRAVIDVP
jgi:hypothetical protein